MLEEPFEWPLIRHEEWQKPAMAETTVDLYIRGDREDHIVQLNRKEYEAYMKVRAKPSDDPMADIVKEINLPEKELCILITGDYHEEEKSNKKAPKSAKVKGDKNTQDENKGNPEEKEAQKENLKTA